MSIFLHNIKYLPQDAFKALIFNNHVSFNENDPGLYESLILGIARWTSWIFNFVTDPDVRTEKVRDLTNIAHTFTVYCGKNHISPKRVVALVVSGFACLSITISWLGGLVGAALLALIIGLVVGGGSGLTVGGVGAALMTSEVMERHSRDLYLIHAQVDKAEKGVLYAQLTTAEDRAAELEAEVIELETNVAELETRITTLNGTNTALVTVVDFDGDGIYLPMDLCPDSVGTVNAKGCSVAQVIQACGTEATVTAIEGVPNAYTIAGCNLAEKDEVFECTNVPPSSSFEACVIPG